MRFFAVLFFLFVSAFPVFSQDKKFTVFQEYEPAYIDADSMLKYEGKLARWEKGWLYTKDVSKKKARWKKTRKIRPEDFYVRIYEEDVARLHEIPLIKNVVTDESGTLAAFTAVFGSSANTSAGIIDIRKNKLLFIADLKHKKKGAPGPGQLAMENTWFFPKFTGDGKYIACDGFSGTGEREPAIISADGKSVKKFPGLAMPETSGQKVFMWERDVKKNINHIVSVTAGGSKKDSTKGFEGRPAGLEAINGKVYAVTGDKIFSFDAETGADFAGIHDYSYLGSGYDFMNAEKVFSGMVKKQPYVFLVLKRIKAGKYDWKLFGLSVD